MFRKKRLVQQEASRLQVVEVPPPPPSRPQAPPPVNAVVLGPPGEARDWVASFISARPDMHLLGIHADSDQASMMLKNHLGPKARALLIGAMIPEPDEGRSVIRMMRERFPALRIVAYGDSLDEMAIEGLYFLGADGVIHRDMDGKEVITAILGRTQHAPDVESPEVCESDWEVSRGAPLSEIDIVRAQERVQAMEVTEQAVDEPAPAVDEPAPAIWEDQGPATDTPSPATWGDRAQAIWGNQVPARKEPSPAVREPPPAVEELPPTKKAGGHREGGTPSSAIPDPEPRSAAIQRKAPGGKNPGPGEARPGWPQGRAT